MTTRQEKRKAADELATLIRKEIESKVFHRKMEKIWNEFLGCYSIRVWEEILQSLSGTLVARIVGIVRKYNKSLTEGSATCTIGARLRENGEPYAVLEVVIG